MSNLPKTAKEAKLIGSIYYFTGKACKHGHIDKRVTKGHTCYTCHRAHSCKSVKKWSTREYRAEQSRLRRQNPAYRIHNNISRAIRYSINKSKNGLSWESIVGWTLQELMTRFKSLFDKNMTVENYGSYWQIDHIKPISSFNIISTECDDFKKCWSLDNLRPLYWKDNLEKGAKYDKS